MMNELKQNIPEGQSDVPILSAVEIEYMRNMAIVAAGITCRWMIDTKIRAPGRCKCTLVECNHTESPTFRLNGEKPFRWKSTLCNPNSCRLFEPKQ